MKLSRPEQYNTLILLLILHLAAGGGTGPQSAPHPTNGPPPHSNSYSYFRQIRERVKRVSSASQLAIFEILKFILGVEAYGNETNETNENALRCSYAKVHFFCFNPLSLKPSMNRLFPKSKIFHILNESKSFKYAS